MRVKQNAARAWLLDLFADGRRLSWAEVVVLGKAAGFTRATLKRARDDIPALQDHRRGFGPGGSHLWRLEASSTREIPERDAAVLRWRAEFLGRCAR